jgi:hypothetical protein
LINGFSVIGAGDLVNTCPQTSAQLMVETGPRSLGQVTGLAFSELKDPVDQPEGVSNGIARSVGPKVESPVLFDPSDDAQARKRGLNIKSKKRVPLVISEEDIVSRQMAFYKGILEYERLLFRGRKECLKTFGPIHHQSSLGRQVPGRREIGQDPLFQVLGLSHIDDLLGLVFEGIYARSLRQIEPKGFGIQTLWS